MFYPERRCCWTLIALGKALARVGSRAGGGGHRTGGRWLEMQPFYNLILSKKKTKQINRHWLDVVRGLVETVTGLEGDGQICERCGGVATVGAVKQEKWIVGCKARSFTNVAESALAIEDRGGRMVRMRMRVRVMWGVYHGGGTYPLGMGVRLSLELRLSNPNRHSIGPTQIWPPKFVHKTHNLKIITHTSGNPMVVKQETEMLEAKIKMIR
ncbi:unnamed protein product [Lactuca virosa]|uniref:Uncharacterized protein n=1 Tax=Lactuca virosa TaxID=75947 RepID=A0AAU9PG16_9ASTR|nr:unnamed protein product [Lactuca virosa]